MKQGTAGKGVNHYTIVPAPLEIEPNIVQNLTNIHGLIDRKVEPVDCAVGVATIPPIFYHHPRCNHGYFKTCALG